MADDRVYLVKSISNILEDDIYNESGNIIKENASINIGESSYCTYRYEFGTEDDTMLKCDYIKITNLVYGDGSNMTSRYNDKASIDIVIQYYDTEVDSENNVTYKDGKKDYFRIMPYLGNEKYYNDDVEISTGGMAIKSIELSLRNRGIEDGSLLFYYVSIYSSLTLQEVITDTVMGEIDIDSIDWYTNGILINYTGGEMITKLVMEGNDTGITGIKVNPGTNIEKYIKINTKSGELSTGGDTGGQ